MIPDFLIKEIITKMHCCQEMASNKVQNGHRLLMPISFQILFILQSFNFRFGTGIVSTCIGSRYAILVSLPGYFLRFDYFSMPCFYFEEVTNSSNRRSSSSCGSYVLGEFVRGVDDFLNPEMIFWNFHDKDNFLKELRH